MADSSQTTFDADQWQCGVCGVAMARGAEVGHPLEPTISVSTDPDDGSVESVATHRICNASPKIRDEYPPAVRETVRMTYEMLEGFTELGFGNPDDEIGGYPDESFIAAWFEMAEAGQPPAPRLHPDEVGALFDESAEVVRRSVSIYTQRIDEFDQSLANDWVGEAGDWSAPDWQDALGLMIANGGLGLGLLSILAKHSLVTEIPRSVGLAPVWGPGMPARVVPASVVDPNVF